MNCRTYKTLLLLAGTLTVLAAGCADDSASEAVVSDSIASDSPVASAASGSDGEETSASLAQVTSGSCAPTTTVKESEFNKSLNKDVALIQPLGPYKVVIETDPAVPGYTLYRPVAKAGEKFPVLLWGEGGCMKDGLFFSVFLREIASYGYTVVADGVPRGGSGSAGLKADGTPLLRGLDLITAQSQRSCSTTYNQLDLTKIAVSGQSCGGLMAIDAGKDPRVTSVLMFNSGLFERDPKIYSALHTPVAIIDGGPSDVAFENGKKDYQAINHVPIIFANHTVAGHGGSYWDKNGGSWALVGVAWLNWTLKGDVGDTGREIFTGECFLCKAKDWTVESKNLK